MEQLAQEDIICKKHDIVLHKKDSSHFSLHLNISNPRIMIPNLINFDIYQLIADINKDVLESVKVTKIFSDDKLSILFIFKRFGAELGMAQKYMHTLVERHISNNQIIFNSKSTPLADDIPEKCEWVCSDGATLVVDVRNSHDVSISYVFHMDLHEDLPIFMEDIAGLLMKKIFLRLKEFIENIK